MKLKEWAEKNGIAPVTAYRWFHNGTLPVEAIQTKTGIILIVESEKVADQKLVVYARVSSHDQKDDLERQVGRVVSAVTTGGNQVAGVITEIGSGLNGSRPRLRKLLADKTVTTICVERRDRLGRFGVDYIEAALSAQGRKILVVDENEVEDDLVRDMTDVLTGFCARLYGKRSAKARAGRALKTIQEAS